jgi:outer membrane receptor protein involved in Fe transport
VRIRWAAILPVVVFLLHSLICFPAEAQIFRGSLVGTVEDTSGQRISGAKIVVHPSESPSVRREVTSDRQGKFRIDDLLPGSYRILANASGFAEAQADVTVVVSSTRAVTVTLKPALVQQTVTVQGRASSIATQPVDPANTVLSEVVTTQDLQNLPLASRSFANIAYLIPGTMPVEPSDPTKARITAVSIGGSSGLNNVLSVDGGDNSDDYIGGFLQNISPDAVQEFAFATSQENADIGRTVGGAVVITTKRGTDQWHGDLAFYGRASDLNARFPIENPSPLPKQPFSRENYIGAIGGPLVKEKLWFFASYEYVHEDASVAYSPASLTQFNALASLAAMGLIPGAPSINVPNNVPVPFRDNLGTVRLDWAQSSRSLWLLRFSADNYTTTNDLVQQAALPTTGAISYSNYLNLVLGQQFNFSPTWLGLFTFAASYLHHTEAPNSSLGFTLAFPFSSTFQTISGFETFGDNQFVTPITAFPVLRNQEKYQLRYDVSHTMSHHTPRFGIDFIHEPVLSGALPGTTENVTVFAMDPANYLALPSQQFTVDLTCTPMGALTPTPVTTCTSTPAGNGSFSQNVQRLGFYAMDTWRVTPRLTINYGLRYDTTFGLFNASNRSQAQNPALLTLNALQIPLINGVPHDYRGAVSPRIGLAYALGKSASTVLRAGFGLYYNDLAQNGWVTAFQAVNAPPGSCVNVGDPGCIPGSGAGALIDSHYKTPYALHASAGVSHTFSASWVLTADFVHQEGNHGYRRYEYTPGVNLFSPLYPANSPLQTANVPAISLFRSDNRSRYDALMIHLQGNVTRRISLIANYTLARADTWGCLLGELFDYVNGVCDPLNPFGPGDYGPSGEDVRSRAVIAGIFRIPGGFELSTVSQFETARPFTITTPVGDRAVVNGVRTTLDQIRGTPYIQVDLRVSRPFRFHDRWTLNPFIEFFNLFNRNNPGANYVTNLAALPTPVNNLANATAFCLNPSCTMTQPITSLNQLRVPAGALGDFFGPGTTVGIPFAAQLGVRLTF